MTGTDSTQLPGAPLQVFLSYARHDLARAETLREQLVTAGFAAYLDRHDIQPGEPWQARLGRLIGNADAVVLLLSPDSVSSAICDWEINEAERLIKRILPVVIADVPTGDVPGRLRRLTHIHLRGAEDQLTGFEQLRTALRQNVDWVREHTRLGSLAADWARRDQAAELLLYGQALDEAERWLLLPPAPGQAVTEQQRSFVGASRQAEVAYLARQQARLDRTRRVQRRGSWALAALALVLLAGGITAGQSHQATSRRTAEVFASKAQEAADKGQLPLALRYAVAGLPPDGALPLDHWSPALERQLSSLAPRLKTVLATLPSRLQGEDAGVLVDPALDRALVLGRGEALLWDTRDGRVIRRLAWAGGAGFHAQLRNGRAVVFDGATLRIVDADSGVELASHGGLAGFTLQTNRSGSHVLAAWSQPAEGQSAQPPANPLRAYSLQTGQAQPAVAVSEPVARQAQLSPDGSRAAFIDQAGVAQLVDLTSGKPLLSLAPADGQVVELQLLPDGKRLLAIVDGGQLLEGRVFDTRDGQVLVRIAGMPRADPDGEQGQFTIAERGDFLYRALVRRPSADDLPQVQVWDLASGAELVELRRSGCARPQISPYAAGNPAVSRAAVVCQQLEIIHPQGRAAEQVRPDADDLALLPSPGQDRLAVGGPGHYQFIDSSSGRPVGLQPLSDRAFAPVFNPTGTRLVGRVGDRDSQAPGATLRDGRSGVVIANLAPVDAPGGGRRPVLADRADFSADGRWLLTQHGSALVLHDGQTGLNIARLVSDPGARPATRRSWFAGRQQDRLVTSHADGTVRLWDLGWQPQQGRALVDLVCRQLLQGPDQPFSDEQMTDPMLADRIDLRTPCDRVGPLRWAWWQRLWPGAEATAVTETPLPAARAALVPAPVAPASAPAAPASAASAAAPR